MWMRAKVRRDKALCQCKCRSFRILDFLVYGVNLTESKDVYARTGMRM